MLGLFNSCEEWSGSVPAGPPYVPRSGLDRLYHDDGEVAFHHRLQNPVLLAADESGLPTPWQFAMRGQNIKVGPILVRSKNCLLHFALLFLYRCPMCALTDSAAPGPPPETSLYEVVPGLFPTCVTVRERCWLCHLRLPPPTHLWALQRRLRLPRSLRGTWLVHPLTVHSLGSAVSRSSSVSTRKRFTVP